MEIRESLFTEFLSAKTHDPYQLSHTLIHAAYKFGHVIEKENSVEASGPRVNSRVHFTLKKEFDKFTSLHIDVYAEGDSYLEELNVSINASIVSETPEARGMISGIFHKQYRDKIYEKAKHSAAALAKDAFLEFQKVLKGEKIVE